MVRHGDEVNMRIQILWWQAVIYRILIPDHDIDVLKLRPINLMFFRMRNILNNSFLFQNNFQTLVRLLDDIRGGPTNDRKLFKRLEKFGT